MAPPPTASMNYAPLLARGVGAIVLENAFYGSRRPPTQFGPALRSISDLHLMGAATFQEGRALLRWIRDTLAVPLAGVTGFSMGGQMAAMVGASMPFPVAIVPVAATCSPDSALREGVLRHVAHWAALAGVGEDADAARQALCAHLSRFSVTMLPPPVCTDAAIVVGASADGVVPPAEASRIAEHWGAELRWLAAGHVSAVLRHQGEELVDRQFHPVPVAVSTEEDDGLAYLVQKPLGLTVNVLVPAHHHYQVS